MKHIFSKLKLFHTNSIEEQKLSNSNYNSNTFNGFNTGKTGEFSEEDFQTATASEKEAMVETKASISYWKDAWRRFRKNTVSMVALAVFFLVLCFAFLGPYLIPYDYESQLRTAQKLNPGGFSEKEKLIKSVEKQFNAFYATSMQSGSMTALYAGKYAVKCGSDIYYFTLDSMFSDGIIAINKNWEVPVMLIKEKDIKNSVITVSVPANIVQGRLSELEKAEYTTLRTMKRVFKHAFGTDSVGRDIMARTMYGARVSIIIGVSAAIIVLVIGALYGAVSGLVGGKLDFVLMRIVELIYSIPEILIVLLLQVVLKDPLQAWFDRSSSAFVKGLSDLGSGVVSILITFALIYWVSMARIVRGQVLLLKNQEFVTAAKALGAGKWRIIKRHLLPNCVGQLVVQTCLQIPSAIFLESFLSFLGLGVSAPMASLGSLCSEALATITLYPFRMTYPSIVLILIVLSLNLIGDGLRDSLDPRLKR